MAITSQDKLLEIEYKLLVTDDAIAVFDRLSRLDQLAGCALGTAELRHIHDYYFDTHDKQLGKAGIALRLREQNGDYLLIIKANEQVSDNGLTQRYEWEQPWHADAYENMFVELTNIGVSIKPVVFSEADDLALMKQTGFEIIQDRETRRIVRAVTCSRASNEMELALDRTRYQVGDSHADTIDHFEIELEICRDDMAHAQAVIDILCNDYPDLVPWQHNKLITGLALQQLPKLHELTQGHSLTKDGYRHLHEYIEHQ